MAAGTAEEPGFLQRHRVAVAAGAVAAVAVAVLVFLALRDTRQQPVRRVQEIQMVTIKPPPPPPPPPQQPPPQPKMIEQPKMLQPETKPPEKPVQQPKPLPPKPISAPPTGPLGLDAKPTGPGDDFNLAGNPGGNGLLEGGGGGTRWGWYATMIQTQIQDALPENKTTRDASIEAVQVRLWLDATGRVVRAQLAASTGSRAVDDALVNDVLTGLKIRQSPPNDMPMPIVLRISGHRPG